MGVCVVPLTCSFLAYWNIRDSLTLSTNRQGTLKDLVVMTLTPLGVVEDLADIRNDVLERVVLGLI